jgi:hypothetical protein
MLVTGALAVPTGSGAATKPALHVTRALPLTVVGTGFRPAERARVSFVIGTLQTARTVRATRRGSFTVRLAGVRLNYCTPPLSIVARGARSGIVRAVLPIADCAAP